MGLRETLNEEKSWSDVEKKVSILRKKAAGIEKDVENIQKTVKALAGESMNKKSKIYPNDWTIPASYATEQIVEIADEVQKIIDMFKD